jgi:hypothetical protein
MSDVKLADISGEKKIKYLKGTVNELATYDNNIRDVYYTEE